METAVATIIRTANNQQLQTKVKPVQKRKTIKRQLLDTITFHFLVAKVYQYLIEHIQTNPICRSPLRIWYQFLVLTMQKHPIDARDIFPNPKQYVYEKWDFYNMLLCKFIANQTGTKIEYDPGFFKDSIYYEPSVFYRAIIGTSLLTNAHISTIIRFSNGWIWEDGAGSGYNGWMIKRYLAHYTFNSMVYCTDYIKNMFPYRFTNVECGQKDWNVIRKIAENDGVYLLIWPHAFYNLDAWLTYGGRKVITMSDHQPTWAKNDQVIIPRCPIFPPINQTKEWIKIGEMSGQRLVGGWEDKLILWMKKQ